MPFMSISMVKLHHIKIVTYMNDVKNENLLCQVYMWCTKLFLRWFKPTWRTTMLDKYWFTCNSRI